MKEHIPFTSVFFVRDGKLNPESKLKVAERELIDVIVEDNPDIATTLRDAGIACLVYRTTYNENLQTSPYLQFIESWHEADSYIKKLEQITPGTESRQDLSLP